MQLRESYHELKAARKNLYVEVDDLNKRVTGTLQEVKALLVDH